MMNRQLSLFLFPFTVLFHRHGQRDKRHIQFEAFAAALNRQFGPVAADMLVDGVDQVEVLLDFNVVKCDDDVPLCNAGDGGRRVRHDGFDIYPLPTAEGGQHRICALVEKDIGGGKRSHWMIRADLLNDRDAAVEASLLKARALIDQQGERIFE